MTTQPKISVIIPVYKAEAYLHRCVDSILNQTFQDFEILLVDDGSPDRSGAICDEYAAANPKVKVFHQENRGAAAARKQGVERAEGQYLCFVDADDYIRDVALDRLVEKANSSDNDIVIGGFCLLKGEKRTFVRNYSSYGADNVSVLCSVVSERCIYPSLCAKLIRRNLFDKIQWVESLSIGEDAAITYQLLYHAKKIGFIDDTVYVYEYNADSSSHKLSEKARCSIIQFCLWSETFFERIGYLDDDRFASCFAENCMNGYYRYLMANGDPALFHSFADRVYSIYLKNEKACRSVPIQRIMLLKLYRLNLIAGVIGRNVLNLIRTVVTN